MAPPANSVITVPSSLTVIDKEDKPWWDGDDLKLPLFLDTLERWMQSEHPNHYAYFTSTPCVSCATCIARVTSVYVSSRTKWI